MSYEGRVAPQGVRQSRDNKHHGCHEDTNHGIWNKRFKSEDGSVEVIADQQGYKRRQRDAGEVNYKPRIATRVPVQHFFPFLLVSPVIF